MARKQTKKAQAKEKRRRGFFGSLAARVLSPFGRLWRRLRRYFLIALGVAFLWILAYAVLPVPSTPYMLSERFRLGDVDYQWTPIDEMSPVLVRSVVAAEDANFCTHWGFDITAIRQAIEAGGARGASTISQQTVKNAYLWQGRSWLRKAFEAMATPVVELVWSKRRIVEVYLNIAEFDEGVFGVEAASYHYFGVGPNGLSAVQAARLAAVLPNPKARDAGQPAQFVRRRAAQIMDGAATIREDGRATCFED